MASVRISLKHEAWRLADRHRDVADADAGLEIPETVIDRLHGIASSAHNPTDTLRWAWLSQHASYMDTASTADGLAAMYLLGALLHADRLEPHTHGDGRRGTDPRSGVERVSCAAQVRKA